MSWYAITALEDAIEATKRLLFPFDPWTWAKLAVVVFFLGLSGGAPPTPSFNSGTDVAPSDGPQVTPGDLSVPPGDVLAIALAVLAFAVVVGTLYALVGSILEFVFVESLSSREVHIRRYASRHFGKGLRLFAFRFVLLLAVAAPILWLFFTAFSVDALGANPGAVVGGLFVFLPAFFLLALVVGLVDSFTTNFVVPVMIRRDSGLLAGWRSFWPTLRNEWKQYGVYLLVTLALSIAAGLAVSIALALSAVAVAIPFVLVGAVVFTVVGGISGVNLVVAGVIAVLVGLYLLSVFAVSAFVQVPVQAYLRYVALLVLGDTNDEFDLVPDLRAEIRGESNS